jgi:hypothetical protein
MRLSHNLKEPSASIKPAAQKKLLLRATRVVSEDLLLIKFPAD